jgi:phosphoribosylanthranilate isomerase
MKIKLCGMTDLDQLAALGDMGVSFAGLIFYPGSPRYVIKHGLKGADVKKEKLKVYKVGVFVDASYDEVMRQVEDFDLDMVQFHGHETPFQCARVADFIDVIKAFRLQEHDNVPWMIKDYYNDADMFLFDTAVTSTDGKDAGQFGGTGKKFDWNKLRNLDIGKPFFLSGGIGPGDGAAIKDFMGTPVSKDLFVVDLNSRFETSPGKKDLQLVRTFIQSFNS